MRFKKISIKKKGVHTVRETKNEHGAKEAIDLESPERPLPSFVDSLQAFKSYVRDLLPFELTEEQLTVTTLNLSEDTNGLRGLVVTATVPIPKAYNNPLVLNTPLVREGGENASPEAFILSDEVLQLIALAESEATRYVNGERVQTELFTKAQAGVTTSENVKRFDERAAAAEVASTRKPKPSRSRKSAADAEAEANTWNPDKTIPPTTEQIRQLLLSVERDVPVDAIGAWSSSERDAAQRWAEARQKELVGQLADKKVPREPECVLKAATPSLKDGWTTEPPKKLDDASIAAVKGAKDGETRRTPAHIH